MVSMSGNQSLCAGKIDFPEMFSGSARLSQAASMQGLRVGAPIDLRTGYDLLTAEGRRKMAKSHGSHRAATAKDHPHGTRLWTMELTTKYQ